jgi:hypothetical protein
MKSIACASLAALLCVGLALPGLTHASADGPSASGNFQFSLEDGEIRSLEFHARVQNNGRTVGEMTFSDQAAVPVPDPDNPAAITSPGTLITAKFDCLQITGKQAVMSGVISESNIAAALGLRVLLVVEDNGEGVNIPTADKLTWGVYQTATQNWIPKDAERDDDNGASLTWIARDFERDDDTGVPSNQSKTIGCQSFPLSSYSFVDVKHGGGNIQVQP